MGLRSSSLLEGKAAVITGGNSGIGFAIASRFIAEGARILIVGQRQDAVAEAVAKLGNAASGLVGDIADLATHERIADEAASQFGQLDIYVANAGVIRPEPAASVSPAEYGRQFDTNTRAVFFGMQMIAPRMADRGSMLMISSIATSKLLDGHAVYAGSKAAAEAFVRAFAIELAPHGIRVNVISPGPTTTPILTKLGVPMAEIPALEAALAGRIPLGRMGSVDDISEAALFLASDTSKFITGVNLAVDGGMSLT